MKATASAPVISALEFDHAINTRFKSELQSKVFQADLDLAKYSPRLLACSQSLRPVWDARRQEYRLTPSRACGVSTCVSCHGRYYRRRGSLSQIQPVMAANPGYVAACLTLTVKNSSIGQLRQSMKEQLHAGFERLSKRHPFKGSIASARCTQITLKPERGEVHPHIHAAFILPESEADSVCTLPTLWAESARLDYSTETDWQIDADVSGWVAYVSRPPVTVSADILLDHPQMAQELHRQLHGSKLYHAGGTALKSLPNVRRNPIAQNADSWTRYEWNSTNGYEYRA